LLHGFAVAVEMSVASALACSLGLLHAADFDRIVATFRNMGLPSHCGWCEIEEIWPVFERRAAAKQPFFFPVPTTIGKGQFLNEFTKDQLAMAIARCKAA
jgi:3-dehydroquinate synthetase